MQMEPFLDVTGVSPEQGGPRHPVGKKFPAIITNTGIKSTKDNTGGYFFITFSTPAGTIDRNYNIWNDNPQTVEIAKKQFAAVAHAIGIYKIHVTLPNGEADFQNAGSEIRNQRLIIDVDYQKGHEPTAEKPQGGYVEVSKIYDANGNEPGKVASAAPQPQQGGSWGGQAATGGTPANTGWPSGPATQNTAPVPAANPPQAPANAGWSQGPQAGASPNPPWANR